MKPAAKTRVQRRVEKKQVTLLVVLVVVIVVISFVLGVIVGRHSTESLTVEKISESRRIVVADPARVPPAAALAPSEPVPEKLTFYDSLSKDDPAPIGSGINLPPDEGGEAAESLTVKNRDSGAVDSAEKPRLSPLSPVKKPETSEALAPQGSQPSRVSPASADRMPAASKGGDWVVQVFSSRSAADAGLLRDDLSAKGYPAFIAEADLGGKGIWYRVLLGPYAEKTRAAQAQLRATQRDKLKGYVRRR